MRNELLVVAGLVCFCFSCRNPSSEGGDPYGMKKRELIQAAEKRGDSLRFYKKLHDMQNPPAPKVKVRQSHSTTPDDAYTLGYEEGYSDGLNDGSSGYDQGSNYDDGTDFYGHYETMYCDGYEEGYNAGYEEGLLEYKKNEE